MLLISRYHTSSVLFLDSDIFPIKITILHSQGEKVGVEGRMIGWEGGGHETSRFKVHILFLVYLHWLAATHIKEQFTWTVVQHIKFHILYSKHRRLSLKKLLVHGVI